MLWEEGQVDTDEHQPEMDLGEDFVVGKAGDFPEPKVETAEDGKDRTHRQDVVGVSYHVVGVVENNVKRAVGQDDSCQTSRVNRKTSRLLKHRAANRKLPPKRVAIQLKILILERNDHRGCSEVSYQRQAQR